MLRIEICYLFSRSDTHTGRLPDWVNVMDVATASEKLLGDRGVAFLAGNH